MLAQLQAELSLLDTLPGGFIALSAVIGLIRGLTREAFGLINWLLAAVLAIFAAYTWGHLIAEWVEFRPLRLFIFGAVVFIATLTVGSLIVHILVSFVKTSGLDGTDRMLGLLFGFLRAGVLLVVLLSFTKPGAGQEAWWDSSKILTALFEYERPLRSTFNQFRDQYGHYLQLPDIEQTELMKQQKRARQGRQRRSRRENN